MKTISRTRKCVGYLALALVLLLAADMYYPAVMCALGVGVTVPSERNAGADIVAAARSQIGVTVKYAPAYEAIEGAFQMPLSLSLSCAAIRAFDWRRW